MAPFAGKDTPALTVSSQATRKDIGIETLVGDFVERGENHGRKCYQKLQKIPGHEDMNVFLYYWDSRDGPDYAGWWFGDEVGGSQVWARCPSHGPTPPKAGWKIPWDSTKAEPGILAVDPYGAAAPGAAARLQGAAAPGTAARMQGPAGAAGSAAAGQIVKAATAEVDEAAAKCGRTLTAVKQKCINATEETLAEAQKTLEEEIHALKNLQVNLTKYIGEARKGGVSATAAVTELSKLSPRIRTLQTSLTTELSKVKALVMKVKSDAPRKAALEAEAQKAEKDMKELQESIPAAAEVASTAQEAVEAVNSMAAPLLESPPEDESAESFKKVLEEIEQSASDAQNKITEARAQINTKLQAARRYAPEARKAALSEFAALQTKLTEAQKKLNPFKTFKKEFRTKVEAKKAVAEFNGKLSEIEEQCSRVCESTANIDEGDMSEDEVKSVEEQVMTGMKAVVEAMRSIDGKLRGADAAVRDELQQLKERCVEMKGKLEAVSTKLRKQKDRISALASVSTLQGKVTAAEDLLSKCQEAEMPFLAGIEVLPQEQSTAALAACESASKEAGIAVSQAVAFATAEMQKAQKLQSDVGKAVIEELKELKTGLDGMMGKLNKFKADIIKRRVAAMVAEVDEAATAAEKKIQSLTEAAKEYSTEDEALTAEAVKEAGEKADAAEKEAAVAVAEAKKVLAAKMRDAKTPDAKTGLTQLQTRLTTAQTELGKQKTVISSTARLIKTKQVINQEEERLTQADDDLAKIEGMAEGELNEDTVTQMNDTMQSTQAALKASQKASEAHLPGAAPAVKTTLQKLVERSKEAHAKIDKVKAATKDQREKAMGAIYIKEGERKVAEVESGIERMASVELPYLKGVEALPLQEALDTVKASEEIITEVQGMINDVRTYFASKNLELRTFVKEVAENAKEAFSKQAESITAAAQQVATFKKETELRKKAAQLQEATEKMTTAEEAAKKSIEAAEPFLKKEEGEALDPEAESSKEKLEVLIAAEKEAQTKAQEVRAALLVCKTAITPATKDQFTALQTRQTELQLSMVKASKIVSDHGKKELAKRTLAEADEQLASAEGELKKANEAAAPLTEEGGQDFLVVASSRTLGSVLHEHMTETESTEDRLFDDASGGEGIEKISEEVFLKYLSALPEKLKRDEVSFPEPRQKALFKYLDADKDGFITLEEFKGMFRKNYVCTKPTVITEEFQAEKGKAIGKCEAGEEAVAISPLQIDESKMVRVQCKFTTSELTGWVTVVGSNKMEFFELYSPFKAFCKEVDKALIERANAIMKVGKWIKDANSKLTPDARAELNKVAAKVQAVHKDLDALKRKVAFAKQEYLKTEKAEKNAHIEAREQKEADDATGEVTKQLKVMEELVSSLEEAAKPLLSLEEADLKSFPTPMEVKTKTEQLHEDAVAKVAELKVALKEVQTQVAKVNTRAMIEAKRNLMKTLAKCEAADRTCKSTLEGVTAACKAIVDMRAMEAQAALRDNALKREVTFESLFSEIAGDTDRIPEEAMCKHLESLEGLGFQREQAQLLCRHIEVGGVGKRRFLAFLKQYFIVVKEIAVTSKLDISAGKTLRKADLYEVMEVIEGPAKEPKLGLYRVRGKMLKDGLEGWVGLRGDRGTPFLEEVEKPFFACLEETALDKNIKVEDGQEPIKTLQAEDVLELIEGPRKEVYPPGLRIRGKAVSDGATGWINIKDKKGVVFAEASEKFLSCTVSVAITDSEDISDCKVVRKLAVGEIVAMTDELKNDAESGVTRARVQALKDKKEGWITVKGNAGTVYAEAGGKLYCMVKSTPLHKTFSSEKSEVVREMEVGEAFQVIEGPKEEKFPSETRVKGCAVADGTVGWITLKGNNANVRPWSPFYSVVEATPLQDKRSTEEATVARDLEVGESVEILEGPVREDDELRMKGRAEKDGQIGWVTIKDKEGKLFLKS